MKAGVAKARVTVAATGIGALTAGVTNATVGVGMSKDRVSDAGPGVYAFTVRETVGVGGVTSTDCGEVTIATSFG